MLQAWVAEVEFAQNLARGVQSRHNAVRSKAHRSATEGTASMASGEGWNYLQEHGIEAAVAKAVHQVLDERPINPLQRLGELIMSSTETSRSLTIPPEHSELGTDILREQYGISIGAKGFAPKPRSVPAVDYFVPLRWRGKTETYPWAASEDEAVIPWAQAVHLPDNLDHNMALNMLAIDTELLRTWSNHEEDSFELERYPSYAMTMPPDADGSTDGRRTHNMMWTFFIMVKALSSEPITESKLAGVS